MKLLKIAMILSSIATMSNAATITVSAGFGAQGFNVTTDGLTSLPSFFVGVGGFASGTFTQFGTSVTDSAKVNAVVQATGPTTLNTQVINLFVGNGDSVATSTSYVILKPNANTAFPADVTTAAGVTLAATVGSGYTLVASEGASWDAGKTLGGVAGNGLITFVPEPSAALLGAIGAIGLLRRRRI